MEMEIENLRNELAMLRQIHTEFAAITASGTTVERGGRIAQSFQRMVDAEQTALFIHDPQSEHWVFLAGHGPRTESYADGVLDINASLLDSLKPLEFSTSNVWKIAIHTNGNRYDMESQWVMLVPISISSQAIAVLLCEYGQAHTLTERRQIEALGTFLMLLGPLVACYRDTRALEEKAQSLKLLYEIGNQLSSIRDEEKLLESILGLIQQHLNVDRCSLMIIDEDQKQLRIRKAFGMPEVDIDQVRVPLGEGIAGYVAAGTRPLLIKDLSAEGHLNSMIPDKDQFRNNSLLSVPLVVQGKALGVINVNNHRDGRPFSVRDMELLQMIGSEIAAVLQRSYMALQIKKSRELDADIMRSMA